MSLKRMLASLSSFSLIFAGLIVAVTPNVANALPASDSNTCYFSNGIAGGWISKTSGSYEAVAGSTAGDTRALIIAPGTYDDRQKLWYGATSYPRVFFNAGGSTLSLGYTVPAQATLTSIDNTAGCMQTVNHEGYSIRYIVRALPGSRIISRIMEVENISNNSPKPWHYSIGGDTWFSGSDYGTAGISGTNPYIQKDASSGIMMYVPIVPAGAYMNYMAGTYGNVVGDVSNVTGTNNRLESGNLDQGLGIRIHGQPIPLGTTVTFGNSTSVGSAAGLQILASGEQKVNSGDRARHRFSLINLGSSPISESLSVSASNGWSARIVGSQTLNINGGQQQYVDIEHILPPTANLDSSNYRSTITLTANGSYHATSSSISEIVTPQLNSLSATCRTADKVKATASWAIPPAKEPVLQLNTTGYGSSVGESVSPYSNYVFSLNSKDIKGVNPVTVSGPDWGFTKNVDLNIPEWKPPAISANDEYVFDLPAADATAIPSHPPITAAAFSGLDLSASCNGAVILSASQLPAGVSFTNGVFTGTPPPNGWYTVKVKAAYTNDPTVFSEKTVLLNFKRPGAIVDPDKPDVPLETIYLNWITGEAVNYSLPPGFVDGAGDLPTGVTYNSATNKLSGKTAETIVGTYGFHGKVGTKVQPIVINVRDGLAPILQPEQPRLWATEAGAIGLNMRVKAYDNIDGEVPLRITGLPTGFRWENGEIVGAFPVGSTSSELRVYAYAKDSSGNEQNGLYPLKLPLVRVEVNNGQKVLTTGGGRPEVALFSPMTILTGRPVNIPVTFIPSTATSTFTPNIANLPAGLSFDVGSRSITGVALDSDLGTKTAIVTGQDSAGGALADPTSRQLVINVVDKTPPTLTGIPDVINIKPNTPFDYQGVAVDGSGDTITWNATNLGEHVLFTAGRLHSAGIPALQSFTVAVSAADAKGNAVVKNVIVNVRDLTPPELSIAETKTLNTTDLLEIPYSLIDDFDRSPTLALEPDETSLPEGIKVGSGKIVGKITKPGVYKIKVKGLDSSGNSVVKKLVLMVTDNTPPILNVVDTIATNTTDSILVQVSATDNSGVHPTLTVEGLPTGIRFDSETSNIIGTVHSPGTYTLVVTAKDELNNTAIKNIVINATDTTPPVFTVNDQNVKTDQRFSVPLNPADNSPIVNVDSCDVTAFPEEQKPALNSSSGVYSLDGTVSTPGTYNVSCIAKDGANNSSTASFQITVKDATPPVINDLDSVYSLHTSTGFVHKFKVVDNSGRVNVHVVGELPSGIVFNQNTLTFSGTPQIVKEYVVNIVASDTGGNETVKQVTFNVLDDTPPTVQNIETTIKTSDSNKEIPVNIADNNDNKIKSVELIGAPETVLYQDGKLIATVAKPGVYRFTLKATDLAENSSIGEVRLTVIDDTPPVATLPDAKKDSDKTWIHKLVITDNDSVENVTCVLDAFKTSASMVVLPVLLAKTVEGWQLEGRVSRPGVYNVSCEATDPTKNRTSFSGIITINDTSSPVIDGVDSSYTFDTENDAQILPSINDNSGKWKVAAINLPPGLTIDSLSGKIVGRPIVPGEYQTEISVTDEDGNYIKQVVIIKVEDTTFPVVLPGEATITTDDVYVPIPLNATDNFSATGNLKVSLDEVCASVGIKAAETGPLLEAKVSRPGMYECQVKISDEAENVTPSTIKVTVKDTTPPVLIVPEEQAASTSVDLKITPTIRDNDESFPKVSAILPEGLIIDSTTGIISGRHPNPCQCKIIIEAEDLSGNKTSKIINLNVTDSTVPVINMNETYVYNTGDEIDIIPDISDNSDEFTVKVAGELPGGLLYSGKDYSIHGATTLAGEYPIKYTVIDKAGNSVSKIVTIIVKDTVPPTVEVNDQEANTDNQFTYTPVFSDNTPHFTVKMIGLPEGWVYDSGTGKIIGKKSTPSIHEISVTVTDGVGNQTTKKFVLTIKDSTAPVITGYLDSSVETGKELFLEGAIKDNDTLKDVKVSSTKGSVSFDKTSQKIVFKIKTPEDAEIVVEATDPAGNKTSKTIKIKGKDTTPPDLTYPEIVYGDTSNSVHIEPTVKDKDKLSYSMLLGSEGLKIDPNTGQITGTILKPGIHETEIKITDPSGNISIRKIVYEIKDTTAPTALFKNEEYKTKVGEMFTFDPFNQVADNSGEWDFSFKNSPPEGLAIDIFTGVLSGKILKPGKYMTIIEHKDKSGNSVIYNVRIIVEENEKPKIEAEYEAPALTLVPPAVANNSTIPLPQTKTPEPLALANTGTKNIILFAGIAALFIALAFLTLGFIKTRRKH